MSFSKTLHDLYEKAIDTIDSLFDVTKKESFDISSAGLKVNRRPVTELRELKGFDNYVLILADGSRVSIYSDDVPVTTYFALADLAQTLIDDHYAKDNHTITVERRVHAIVNTTVEYRVSKAAWSAAIENSEGDEAEALDALRDAGDVDNIVRIAYSDDVDETTEVHSTDVTVD